MYEIRKWLSDLCYVLAVWLDPRIWKERDCQDDSYMEWISGKAFEKKSIDWHPMTDEECKSSLFGETWIPTESDLEALDNNKCPACGGTLYDGACNICMMEGEGL